MKQKYGTNNNDYNSPQVNNQLSLTPVRVEKVILDDKDSEFKKFGGWNGLGTIKYSSIYSELNGVDVEKLPSARPFFPNIKHYPIMNEIVYIIQLPNNTSQNNNNMISYYLDVISIWNHPHHNAMPSVVSPSDNNYVPVSGGSVRKTINPNIDIDLGKTFKERPDVQPLLPFEGDTIYEGRWGNSIRFGSTVKNSNIPNLWSNIGTNGDPIIIIRNGTKIVAEQGWIPTLEDINNDQSSIYFTSNQSIPIQLANPNWESFNSKISNPTNKNVVLQDVLQPVQTFPSSSSTPVSSSIQTSENYTEEDLSKYFPNDDLASLEVLENFPYSNIINNTIDVEETSLKGNTNIFYKVIHQVQKSNVWCLIASTSMVLKYMGYNMASQEYISTFTDTSGNLNLGAISKKLNISYNTESIQSIEDVVKIIKKNNVPLILEKKSLSFPYDNNKSHFIVITGLDENDNVIIHDPANKKGINNILKAKNLKSKGSIRILA